MYQIRQEQHVQAGNEAEMRGRESIRHRQVYQEDTDRKIKQINDGSESQRKSLGEEKSHALSSKKPGPSTSLDDAIHW